MPEFGDTMSDLTTEQVREAVNDWMWARRMGSAADFRGDMTAFDRWLAAQACLSARPEEEK